MRILLAHSRILGTRVSSIRPPLHLRGSVQRYSAVVSSAYPLRSSSLSDHLYLVSTINNNNLSSLSSSSQTRTTTKLSFSSTMSSSENNNLVEFQLSPSTVVKIQIGDITRWFVDASSDAIVNPANERMLGGGGADGAIHRAAGPELREACYKVPEVRPGVRCPTGEARITPGFKLPASHVIHTVGPIYDADSNPEASLQSAYRNSLKLAKENNIQYVAFPAISCGVYGYPYDEAAKVALSTVKEFPNDFTEVNFVLFSDDIYNVWLKQAKELLQN